MTWKNRIVGQGEKPASEFNFNPLNWRHHTEPQRAALTEVLSKIGWVTGVIENTRTGNLIDGHARVEEAVKKNPNEPVPFTLVDLTEEEERKILAIFDPIGGMATPDDDKLWDLLSTIEFGSGPLDSLLDELREPMNVPEFREFDEDIENEVEFIECPQCQHRFPK